LQKKVQRDLLQAYFMRILTTIDTILILNLD
jgi:hypothetical protein